MKELLELVIDLVKELPELAIWVLVIIFAYKIAVVGSIYGVIRFCVGKIHDIAIARKTKIDEVEIRGKLDGITITGEVTGLLFQIRRLVGIRTSKNVSTSYIHKQDIEWLREAIDEKLEREKESSQ